VVFQKNIFDVPVIVAIKVFEKSKKSPGVKKKFKPKVTKITIAKLGNRRRILDS
jgi:hypothetical protein